MILSDISIKRPVLAIVLNLLIVLAGITSFLFISIREYPDVENPLISITTEYPGASPETVETTITQVLEEALNGLTDVRTITSKSAYGHSSINVEFKPNRDIDIAATDVNNAIQSALRKIPPSAERPSISKSGANSDAIIWISLQGKNYSTEELSDIADRIIKPQLQILPGVSSVIIGGQRKYAMRIWLDPRKMAAKNIDINDVRETLLQNNIQLPAGQVKGNFKQFNILADGQTANPRLFENFVVRKINNIPIYIKDIGYVELGSENYDSIARFEGNQIVGLGIVKQSKANELKVSEVVKKVLPSIKDTLPKDLELKTVVDRSLYVNAALNEVFNSLILALLLVVFVTLIFLKKFTTTTIISITIPISLIGAFAGMYILGFSINVLTMLAMVIAIGIVVDDAIVVLENIHRRQEEGESKTDAAVNGSREVGFPVIATTLCLIAIFIPLSMLTGTTGRLFKEFSLVLALAVGISGFVSLTLTPALCSLYLNHKSASNKNNVFEKIFTSVENLYADTLRFFLKNKFVILVFIISNFLLSFFLFTVIPKTFVPTEDRGYFITIIKAPQGSTLAYTSKSQEVVEKEIASIKEVTRYFSAIGLGIGGPPNPNTGIVFASLKHWKDRKRSQQSIVQELFFKLINIPGALIFPINPPSLGQQTIGKDIEFVIKGTSDLNKLLEINSRISEKIKNIPGLINIDSDLLINNPQLDVIFNRQRIADAGFSVEDISKTLQLLFSESRLNDFILRTKQYDVITSLTPKYKSSPKNISEVYIRNKSGHMAPLDSFIKLKATTSPVEINHFDLQRAVTISASLLPGFAIGEMLEKINKIVSDELESGFSTALSGVSREYEESSKSLYITFLISLIFIYLTLSATFESFIHPFTIMLTVPLALLGALSALKLTGGTLNIYSQIGIVLLIGLVTKNSILIVDYANAKVKKGIDIFTSITEACKIRFRPIIMTSITTILGTVPLVLATGAGAEARQALGLVTISGLAFSTIFTLFVIPVVYVLISRRP